MKQISQPKIIDLNPSDFKGLDNRMLQEKVRSVSMIELSEPTALENINVEIFISRTWSTNPRLSVVYFGKDVHSNNEVHWPCAIEPYEITVKNVLLVPSEKSINKWYDFANGETLIVERIGFFSSDELSFTALVKATELIGENGFLDMK